MRTITVEVYGYSYAIAADQADAGRLPADAQAAGWFPYFASYEEDDAGRLVYLWQPLCASARGFREDRRWLREHPRPHYQDVYDRVEIVDESSGKVYQTLTGVDFLTILDAMLAVFEEFDRRRAALGG